MHPLPSTNHPTTPTLDARPRGHDADGPDFPSFSRKRESRFRAEGGLGIYQERASIALLLCSILWLLGCASKPQEDTFNTDMVQYLEKARSWVTAETKVNDAVVAVRRDQFVHDDLTIEKLKPALDVIKAHIDDLEKYQPRTPRVQDAHQRYVKAWRANHSALTEIVTAVEKKDYVYLATANGNLMAAQGMVAQALDELRSLMEEAGLLAAPPPGQTPPGGQAPPQGQAPPEGQPPA